MIINNISVAIEALNKGSIIGLPTETVYGLAGNALNEKAVKHIYELKNRPTTNPLILHTHSLDEVSKYVIKIPPVALKLADAFWPGPLTLLLQKNASIPYCVTSGSEQVAVRIPNHPVAMSLLSSLAFPLVAPSANPYTRISPTTAQMVFDYFGTQLPVILDGGSCEKGIESTIIGFDGDEPIVYRQGAISIDAIEFVVGKVKYNVMHSVVTPGMSKVHYAPRTSMFIVDDVLEFISTNPGLKIGFIGMGDDFVGHSNITFVTLTKSNDLEEASANLYQSMYYLDGLNLDCIIIKKFPELGIGKALNDRITRATFNAR